MGPSESGRSDRPGDAEERECRRLFRPPLADERGGVP